MSSGRVGLENCRQVFVEAPHDAFVYSAFYEAFRAVLSPEIGLSFVAAGTKGDAETLRPGAEFDSERSTFRKQKYTALVSYSLGAAVTGIGIYMLHRVRRRNAESRVRVGVNTAAGGGVFWVRWDN